jgi:hypothetical protein
LSIFTLILVGILFEKIPEVNDKDKKTLYEEKTKEINHKE